MQYREDLRVDLTKIIEEKGPILFGSQDEFDNKRVLVNGIFRYYAFGWLTIGFQSLRPVKSKIHFNSDAFEVLEDEMLL